jgi:ferredoxin, 2Fe-2S
LPTVRVEPSGIQFEVDPGESVAEAAWRLGYTWPTLCWGQAECMVCVTKVIEAEDHTEPQADEERTQMQKLLPARLLGDAKSRLACRLLIKGEGVVLEKRGVRPPS